MKMVIEANCSSSLYVAAVEAIYQAAAAPAGWLQALQAIADVFGDVGALLIWRRDDGSFGTIVSPPLQTALKEYGRWQHADIRAVRGFERSASIGLPDVVTDRHLVTPKEIEEHPFYTQFLIPNGLGWLAAAKVSPDAPLDVWISIQRAIAKPAFSDDDLGVLLRLARHAEQALRLSVRLFDAELTKFSLGDALGRIGVAVFVLDSLKRVIFANPAADGLVGDGLALTRDRKLTSRPENAAFAVAIDEISRATSREIGAPKPFLIQRPKAERPLALYLLPVMDQGIEANMQFLTQARVIVLAMDWRRETPADPAVVRDIFGLTLGEARVAALVGAGLPPKDAAVKLGITEETARTVLKRVFAKAGVSRQSELTALLMRLILR
jgi:DNA-binding CsgD family transcriptional regulator